jgi:hypothetical protein
MQPTLEQSDGPKRSSAPTRKIVRSNSSPQKGFLSRISSLFVGKPAAQIKKGTVLEV